MADSKFDFKKIENKWKKYWEKERIFKADLSKKEIYSIDTPPPTVSGMSAVRGMASRRCAEKLRFDPVIVE